MSNEKTTKFIYFPRFPKKGQTDPKVCKKNNTLMEISFIMQRIQEVTLQINFFYKKEIDKDFLEKIKLKNYHFLLKLVACLI